MAHVGNTRLDVASLQSLKGRNSRLLFILLSHTTTPPASYSTWLEHSVLSFLPRPTVAPCIYHRRTTQLGEKDDIGCRIPTPCKDGIPTSDGRSGATSRLSWMSGCSQVEGPPLVTSLTDPHQHQQSESRAFRIFWTPLKAKEKMRRRTPTTPVLLGVLESTESG